VLQSRNRGGDDDTISCEVAKSFEPTGAIVLECIPFEKGHVKSVCVVYEFLKVLQGIEGNLGCEERALQALEKVI